MNKYKVQITKEYTDQDMEDIVVTALEGGIGYWACLDNTGEVWDRMPEDLATSEYAWRILKEDGELHFLDEEDDDAEYFLSLPCLMNGIRKAITGGQWDGDMDTVDAEVADAIFQYAIFDDIIYG